MRRIILFGWLSMVTIVLAAAPAPALKIAMPANLSLAQKMIAADAVVKGTVTSIEKETVELEQYPNGPKVAHCVAIIKLETALIGGKNVTHIKVVFPKPGEQPTGDNTDPPGAVARPIARPIPGIGRGGFGPISLTEKQEGLFFLSKHPSSDLYYQINAGHRPLSATDENYQAELAEVIVAATAFADPLKALAAEKIEDRVQSALMLAFRYRSYPVNNQTGVIEEVEIPAEESKLILKVLLDADWAKTDALKVSRILGLEPGQYGIPDVRAAEGENLAEVRKKTLTAWHAKFGDQFQVKKIVPKAKTTK
jgi:hypothetical protein